MADAPTSPTGSRTRPPAPNRTPRRHPGLAPPWRGRPASVMSATLRLTGGDRRHRVPDVDEVRRPAGLGRVVGAARQAEVLGHRDRPEAGRVAGAVVGVDVGERQPGVGQRAGGDLGVHLGHRAVGDLAAAGARTRRRCRPGPVVSSPRALAVHARQVNRVLKWWPRPAASRRACRHRRVVPSRSVNFQHPVAGPAPVVRNPGVASARPVQGVERTHGSLRDRARRRRRCADALDPSQAAPPDLRAPHGDARHPRARRHRRRAHRRGRRARRRAGDQEGPGAGPDVGAGQLRRADRPARHRRRRR